jgi:hypothetical protein
MPNKIAVRAPSLKMVGGRDASREVGKIARLATKIWRDMQDEDGQHILQNIRVLRQLL